MKMGKEWGKSEEKRDEGYEWRQKSTEEGEDGRTSETEWSVGGI